MDKVTVAEIIETLRQYPQSATVNFCHVKSGGQLFELSDIEGDNEPSKETSSEVTVWLSPLN